MTLKYDKGWEPNIIDCGESDDLDNAIKCRYILGREGKRPLVCIGMNPSTADDKSPDNTVLKVQRLAKDNGYDGWIMFNVYPIRATNPKKLPAEFNQEICNINVDKVTSYCIDHDVYSVWGAWGDIAMIKPYISEAINLLWGALHTLEIKIFHIGTLTIHGNPRHPLFVKCDLKRKRYSRFWNWSDVVKKKRKIRKLKVTKKITCI